MDARPAVAPSLPSPRPQRRRSREAPRPGRCWRPGPGRPQRGAEGPTARRPHPGPGYLAAAAPPPAPAPPPRLTPGARRRRRRRRRRLPHSPRRRAEPGPSPPPSAPPPAPLLPPPPSCFSQDMVSAGPRAAPGCRRRGGEGRRGGEEAGDPEGRGQSGKEGGFGRCGLLMATARDPEPNKPRGGQHNVRIGPRRSPPCHWPVGRRRRSQWATASFRAQEAGCGR
jgi:hypothetical protein